MAEKVAEIYGPKFGKQIDPMKEILISPGAHGAINSIVSAYIKFEMSSIIYEKVLHQLESDTLSLAL